MDLVLPVKSLHLAKTRLRGAADNGLGDSTAHARLTLALAHDTLAAARAAAGVRRVLVVSSDPLVAAELGAAGVEVVPDGSLPGLNAAYVHGVDVLRGDDAGTPVGALQADLPALRPWELEEAIARFAAGGARRAYCTDAEGTGTTVLLAAPGVALDPLFGVGSAARHARSGAVALDGEWPGLRQDVDTVADLHAAAALGVGHHTEVFTRMSAADVHDPAARGEECRRG